MALYYSVSDQIWPAAIILLAIYLTACYNMFFNAITQRTMETIWIRQNDLRNAYALHTH